jgi:16S rRNA (uracil1498-N3)-methyltransferase
MILFYCHHIENDLASFDEVEMRHCIQVLRKRVGDEIMFADGKGSYYQGIIQSSNKKGFTATIIAKEERKNHLSSNLHLGIAPTKNIDRFEWFLEKATEFGISEITPLLCSNSERKQIRPDRLEKILLSAMKQSLHAHLPKLHAMRSFEDFVKMAETDPNQQRFIAHCQESNLPHLFNNYTKGGNVLIAIGPEGDFSKEEISLALENNFHAISLGTSRLRTETAGIAAVHIVNLKNN